jgi:prevent-host-death family protein
MPSPECEYSLTRWVSNPIINQLVNQLVYSMKEIGIFEAKTRFSEVAKQVQATGQPVRVTNRGKEMVDITPIAARATRRRTREQAFLELSRLRQKLPKSSLSQIKADIAKGRR